MNSYVNFKFYTWQKSLIEDMKLNLKKRLKTGYSFVSLPTKKNKLVIRVGPSGRGYSNYKKYGLSLRRGFCRVYNLNLMNVALKCVNIPGVYLNTSVEN